MKAKAREALFVIALISALIAMTIHICSQPPEKFKSAVMEVGKNVEGQGMIITMDRQVIYIPDDMPLPAKGAAVTLDTENRDGQLWLRKSK